MQKRQPIHLNRVFILSFFCVFLFFVFSCNQIIEKNKYNGTWILKERHYTEKISFKDGNYTKQYSSDDIRVHSNGKFYLNRNENRFGTTLSLIPDKMIMEKDTVFQDCENLDVIEMTDSTFTVQKSHQWARDARDKWIQVNEFLVYKKQKNKD
ncbi:hypothetical protein ACFFLS_02950 [Flavobacterium procerum]|uniref:Lipocalin-like domain-containing protein n=1 Tax=Flavobacterium procerum TaxID=1455569 RepID=A0ABV6BKM4_9FLAO